MRLFWRVGIFLGIQLILMTGFAQAAWSEGLGNESPAVFQGEGTFDNADLDKDGNPDHLALNVPVEVNTAGEYWLSAEIQMQVNGEWQTINYTAVSFQWLPGKHNGRILFYGGEFLRRQEKGACRVVANLRMGGWETKDPYLQEAPAIHSVPWQASNIAATDGPINTASEAIRLARTWAEQEQKQLGDLTERSFAFDRWRMDFLGTKQQPPRRVWVDPSGDISVVDRNQTMD